MHKTSIHPYPLLTIPKSVDSAFDAHAAYPYTVPMRTPIVSVRISLKARNRLKIRAAQAGMTLIKYVDSLLLKTH